MYHNILLRKDHPQQEELEKAIEMLLLFSNAHTLYFSEHLEENLNLGVLTAIVPDDSPVCWEDLNSHYWKIFQAFPQFSIRIFDFHWMKEELEEGNPFFVIHCNSNTLVYSTEEISIACPVKKLKPKRFLKKATSKFRADEHAAFIVGLNVKFYAGTDNLQAAYMLHQNLRWLYVAASWFLTGEWLVANDLEVQQEHVGRFSAGMGQVFDKNNTEEKELMAVLNSAYRCIQKGEEQIKITTEQIKIIEAKKEWVWGEVRRLFKQCECRCAYEFSRTAAPSKIQLDVDDPLYPIAKIVTETVKPAALYCFGKRELATSKRNIFFEENVTNCSSIHYYLFLIVNDYKSDAAGNIAEAIRQQTRGRCSATIVMHSKKSLRQRKGDQQYFFYHIMQRGQLLLQESAKPPFVPFKEIPLRNINSAKLYLQQRTRTAAFLKEAKMLDNRGAKKVSVFLMRLVVEQTCLGLIRLFLGYTPHQFSLSFLFELCEYFSPLTAILFPRESEKDRELLRILSGYTTSLRHGSVDDVHTQDYEVLGNRYNEFVDKAGQLADEELKRLLSLVGENEGSK